MGVQVQPSPLKVETQLNFLKTNELTTEKPHIYMYPHEPRRNHGDEAHKFVINDIRGRESEFNLDKNGFQIYRSPAKEKEFIDEDAITKGYYKEVEDLLKKATGAYKVYVFDHTIRRNNPGEEDTPQTRHPVSRVHIDQTPWAGEERVRIHLPDEAEKLLSERVRIINVWRPINGPVEDFPLALGDFQSIDFEKDLVPVSLKYKDREGETFSVKYNPNLQFYYKSRMENDEVVLIKCFENDWEGKGRARLTPHTAFVDPNTPPGAKGRESIEVRALVFSHRD